MHFPVDHSKTQIFHPTCFSVARHRAEWGTCAGAFTGVGGEGTMLRADNKTTD